MHHFQTQDGAVLAYQDAGQGLPVLALAGLTRDSRDFDYLAPHLPDVRLVRLDSRGRGASAWTGATTYTVAQEAADALALLDHLGIEQAAVIGSSRGGLLAMVMAATHPHRLLGICFNDIGPVIEPAGLARIGAYIGMPPTLHTLDAIARAMPLLMPGFVGVGMQRWQEETERHFVQHTHHVGLTYDPALRTAFAQAMAAAPADAWPLFDACAHLPLALIRGANSDILSASTAHAMHARRPDLHFADIPDRGHIPFLDEPLSLACIHAWLATLRA